MKSRGYSLLFGLMICTSVLAFSPSRMDESDTLIRLQKPRFLVFYNPVKNCPALVVWSLSVTDLGRYRRPASQSFLIDNDCPRPRAKSSDYVHTGYQRGHLCPSADRSADIQLMRATFVMSNVAPMCPDLNMQAFAQSEDLSRSLARRGHRCLMVAGAIFGGDSLRQLGESTVTIPDSFFRACIVPDAPSMNIYWLFPNSSHAKRECIFRVSRSDFVATMRKRVKDILNSISEVW